MTFLRKYLAGLLLTLLIVGNNYCWGNAVDLYTKQADLPVNIRVRGINNFFPDSKGFIWLATSNGFYRWDGLRAQKYESEMNAEVFTSVAEDPQGNIWVGCKNGAILYVSDENLVIWREPDSSVNKKVTDLLFDTTGNLWWGTNGSGLYLYNGKETMNISMANGLPDNYIYSIQKGNNNDIWAATDRGIAKCKIWKGILEINSIGQKDGLPDEIVRVVELDDEGQILLGFHQGGVCICDKPCGTFKKVSLENTEAFGQINSIISDKNGYWVVDEENGLLFSENVNNPIFRKVRFHGELIPEKIKSVCKDAMGNLWILGENGLFVSTAASFTRIQNLYGFDMTQINYFLTEDWETFWGTAGNRLFRISPEGTEVFLEGVFDENLKITSLDEDSHGNLIMATFGKGIVVFNKKNHSVKFITEKDGLINNNVLDISIKGNSMWAATLGGASYIPNWSNSWFQKKQIESFDKEYGLGNNFIYNILQDSKGNVWFGTDGNGLAEYTQGNFIFYDESNGLADDVIYYVGESSNGDIWLNTASSGIYRFDGKGFYHFGKDEGLSSQQIFALMNRDNFIFILTENGLNVLDKRNNDVLNLNEELGFRQISPDMNSGFANNGILGFATKKGIIKIDTRRLHEYQLKPLTLIDRISTNLESIDRAGDIEFAANENSLIFEFTGHWYMAPRKVRFSTRLNGYDSIWNTTNDRRASFSGLASGKYNFQVSAFLNDGMNKVNPVSFDFRIRKPVYARWWFIVLMIVAVVVLIYWIIRYREKNLKNEETRKKEKLEFEFQTLKNQINPHFLFNSFSTLISMIEDDTEQAVDYTQAISDFLREILEVKEQELISLREELTMINNYYFIQKKRFGDNLNLVIDLDHKTQESLLPPLSLQLLIENAIKHNVVSRMKPLTISISTEKEHIVIKNNKQPKKQIEVSTGIGLKNIKERYQLLAGKQVIVKENKKEFIVLLPLIHPD